MLSVDKQDMILKRWTISSDGDELTLTQAPDGKSWLLEYWRNDLAESRPIELTNPEIGIALEAILDELAR